MLYQDIALGAAQGASQLINGAAKRFIYSAGSAGGLDASIVVHTNSGQIKLYPGQWFEPERPETMWMVRNATGAGAIKGTVILTSGEFGDQTITGAVQVVDGGKARTLAKSAFWGAANAPATVGGYCLIQLWNDAASGKNLIVESVAVGAFGTGNDCSMHLGFNSQVIDAQTNYAPMGNAISKLASGPVSSAVMKRAVPASSPVSSGVFSLMVDIYVRGMDTKPFALREPIAVPPGYGLCVDCGNPNIGIAANFEFYEEPV